MACATGARGGSEWAEPSGCNRRSGGAAVSVASDEDEASIHRRATHQAGAGRPPRDREEGRTMGLVATRYTEMVCCVTENPLGLMLPLLLSTASIIPGLIQEFSGRSRGPRRATPAAQRPRGTTGTNVHPVGAGARSSRSSWRGGTDLELSYCSPPLPRLRETCTGLEKPARTGNGNQPGWATEVNGM